MKEPFHGSVVLNSKYECLQCKCAILYTKLIVDQWLLVVQLATRAKLCIILPQNN